MALIPTSFLLRWDAKTESDALFIREHCAKVDSKGKRQLPTMRMVVQECIQHAAQMIREAQEDMR